MFSEMMTDSIIESKEKKALQKMRIIICGKGGSGKSSTISLMGIALIEKGYKVLMLDGDASNPGGVCRLLFGNVKKPRPLFDFFGGREAVECPVDNPKPLTRLNDTISVVEKNISLDEIPQEYIISGNGIKLLQVGKINQAYEGCDGPMSKISRDFIVKGDYVTLIDVEAGVEHFGRGIEENVDIILSIIDPTFESFFIAEKVALLSKQINRKNYWAILNKVKSSKIENRMKNELERREIKILGSIFYDPAVELAGLMGTELQKTEAFHNIVNVVEKLEKEVSLK